MLFSPLDQNLPLPDVISDQLRNHVETILQKLPQDLQLVLKRDTYSSGNGENISTLTTNEQDINDEKKWKTNEIVTSDGSGTQIPVFVFSNPLGVIGLRQIK